MNIVTLVAMVFVSGNYSNSRVTFLWLLLLCISFFKAWHEVCQRRSVHPSLQFSDNFLPHSVSIFHHSIFHSSILLAFNFCSFFTLPCNPLSLSYPHLSASVYFSVSPSLLLTCPHLSVSHLLAIHLLLSLLFLCVTFYFPLSMYMLPCQVHELLLC